MAYEPPVFEQECRQNMTMISEIVAPAMILDMDVYHDYVLLMYLADSKWIHIYDKTTGNLLKSSLTMGRGPGESIGSIEFTINKGTGDTYVFDKQSKKLLTFQIDSIIADRVDIEETANDYNDLKALYTVGDGIEIHEKYQDGNARYSLIRNGSLKSTYNDYPVEDPDLAFRLYNDHRWSVSPDNKKMAVGTLSGAILEGFDLSDGTIHPLWTHYYVEPLYNTTTRTLDYDKNGIGFADVYATDELIYTSYGGNKDYSFKNIAIFDWNGAPLKRIETDVDLVKICFDERENAVYALTSANGVYSIGSLSIN